MKLNNTINRLTKKPTNSVTITNMETAEKVVCNVTGKTLMEEHGTIENFFESLYKKGIKKIKVSDRNPHGSTTTPCGEPYQVLLGSEDEGIKPTENKAAIAEPIKASIMPALNGAETLGLSGAQIETAGRLYNYPKLVTDLQTATSKIDRLESENIDLKSKLQRIETLDEKGERTAQGNTQTLSMVKEVIKEAMPLFIAFKGSGTPAQSPPGLSGINPIQQQAVNALLSCDDASIKLFGILIEKSDQEAVWNDLDILMTKHGIA